MQRIFNECNEFTNNVNIQRLQKGYANNTQIKNIQTLFNECKEHSNNAKTKKTMFDVCKEHTKYLQRMQRIFKEYSTIAKNI